ACASLAACMLVLILVPRLKNLRKAAFPLVMCGVLLSCAINGFVLYSFRFEGFVGDFVKNTNTVSQIQKSEFSLLSRIEDDSFYRVDTSEQRSEKENYGLVLGYNGISIYNSFLNGYAVEYLLDQESTGVNAIHRIHGLKGHTAAEALALVKYFMVRRGDEAKLPYGFEKADGLTMEKIKKSGGQEETVYYDIYENKYPLTFGYTYDTYILREDYEKLSAIEKQQVQLEAVVTDSVPGEMNAAVSCSDEIIRGSAALPEGTEAAVRTETGYQILAEDTELSVPFTKKAGYECYVRLGGFYRPVSLLPFYVHTSDMTEMIPLRGEGKTYSLERRDYMVYLGSSREDGEDTLTFKFPKTGAYELSSIEFIYVPTDGYEEKISSLGSEALRDVETDINTITGKVTLEQGKFMVFAIPYSDGWKLTVDGKKTEIMHANVGYMGVYLAPGEHSIRLDYSSPYSAAGRASALICWGIFIAGAVAGRRRRKKPAQGDLPNLQ
ncbi:MAG: YfhO family protein, partial [Lachnospiraceae bacterium]|nr:YfhO family protein [Lachnospiraceae bacterium]